MNKLQLYINRTGHTFKSLLNLNPNEDVRKFVCDLRRAVNAIEYDSEEKNIFYYVSASDEGSFFTIIRTIPPEHGNHLAAWIYVPNGLDISAEELYRLVQFTARKVSNSDVTADDVAALRDAFSKEYPTLPSAPAMTACQGTDYAWRTYGPNTGLELIDFTGRGRWQQSYLPYAGVILVDDQLGLDVKCDNISDAELGEPATLEVPEMTENGFTAYVFGRKLNRPMLATLGATLQVTWRRPGFEDVVVDQVVDSRRFTPEPVATDNSHKTITPESFYITSQQSREPMSGCSIRVNGRDITAEGRSFTSEELRQAAVIVSCDGYFPFSGTLDLASTKRALIQLQERRKIYCFEMPLVSSSLGGPVRFELRVKKELTASPIEGYQLLDEIQEGSTRTNHLGFTGVETPLKAKLVYAALGFVVGAILAFILGTCTRSTADSTLAPAANPDSVVAAAVPAGAIPAPETQVQGPEQPQADEQKAPEAEEKPEAPAPANAQASAADIANAVKYLDSNKTWDRAELEKNPATRGLFDDMNNFRLDKLIDVWGPKLKDSEKMQRVVTHSRYGKNKKKADHTPPYDKKGDNVITVQSYLNRVDP